MTARFVSACALIVALSSGFAHARCPDVKESIQFVVDFIEKRPTKAFNFLTSQFDAYCSQGRVAAELARHMGSLAGFKAGLTSKAVQQKLSIDAPVRGYLFKDMFLADNAEIAADFGARPLFEADLIAVVKDSDLQSSKTALEALQHVSHFIPFIELPDLMLAEGEPLTANNLIAINAGTRHGVLGTPIAVQPTQEFLDRLASMTVIMTDQTGAELGRAAGSAIMDNPVNSVLWLSQHLAYSGLRLEAGDKLSLGSFMPPGTPRAGGSVKVQYVGLPGDPSVSVRFK